MTEDAAGPTRRAWRRAAAALIGVTAGVLAGAILSLSLVVALAYVRGAFLDGPDDVIGPLGLPVLLLPGVGAWLGWTRPRALARVCLHAALGLLSGIFLGMIVGDAVAQRESGPWAGAILAGGVGVLAGGVIGALRRRHRGDPPDEEAPRGTGRVAATTGMAALVALLAVTSEATRDRPLPDSPPVARAEPEPASVDAVLFLLGDPGQADPGRSPLLLRMARDVERWSGLAARDSTVAAIVLGDILYPVGLRAPERREHETDTARLAEQIRIVDGPDARAQGTRLMFIPGNHDWGREKGFGGAERLVRLDEWLVRRQEMGGAASLLPAPGTGGPAILDLGAHLRVVMFDSAWWLLGSDPDEKAGLLGAIQEAMDGADGRRIVVAAHHPFRSGGPHGALVALSGATGLRMLLSKSGAMLQDLHSGPYIDLLRGLSGVFAITRPPDLFVGGHEHSAQVLEGTSETDPATLLVIGSGSKLSRVGPAPGMLAARSEPSYAKLFVHTDGTLELFVESTPAEYLTCPEDEAERVECMVRGTDAFRTFWAGEVGR